MDVELFGFCKKKNTIIHVWIHITGSSLQSFNTFSERAGQILRRRRRRSCSEEEEKVEEQDDDKEIKEEADEQLEETVASKALRK